MQQCPLFRLAWAALVLLTVIAALALPQDAKVADLGSATGYFAVRLARAVPKGRVYGVDIEPDMTSPWS